MKNDRTVFVGYDTVEKHSTVDTVVRYIFHGESCLILAVITNILSI